MRHAKRRNKLGRTSSHRSCMISNMLKDLICNERIETTLAKAKELRRHADKLITVAKGENVVVSKRAIKSILKLQYNQLSSKDRKKAKEGDRSAYNTDRNVFQKLDELKSRYANRQGGYSRITKGSYRVGDSSEMCIIEYIH